MKKEEKKEPTINDLFEFQELAKRVLLLARTSEEGMGSISKRLGTNPKTLSDWAEGAIPMKRSIIQCSPIFKAFIDEERKRNMRGKLEAKIDRVESRLDKIEKMLGLLVDALIPEEDM